MPTDTPPLETLRIEVWPLPETNDHQVCLLGNGQDLIARLSHHVIGLDPDDILVEPSPLVASKRPRAVAIGRCDCGVSGCDDLQVTIAAHGQAVTWTSKERSETVRFDAAQYDAEVRRALSDSSWETPDRTAARLIRDSIDQEHLAKYGLRFTWASGRVDDDEMTIALRHDDGPYQILVCVPWAGEAPFTIAMHCCRLLREAPQRWKNLRWHAQAPDLGAPAIAGPDWESGG